MSRGVFVLWLLTALAPAVEAQRQPVGNQFRQKDKFRQLGALLPTPSEVRLASGAPGPRYWQQKVDYQIDVELDDRRQRVVGRETITYHNRSPHTLRYLWLELIPNLYTPDSDGARLAKLPQFGKITPQQLRGVLARTSFDGGVKLTSVLDAQREPLPYTVNGTQMRIDLPRPLRSGQSFRFSIAWHHRINDAKLISGPGGCEYFAADGNWIYEVSHWFPRVVAYSDLRGWHTTQYLGGGEFALEYGDYEVRITAPDDHVVTATGVLQNPEAVLTEAQRERLAQASTAKRPVHVVTPAEARANQQSKPKGKKTWHFKASQVRDFAFASSRKFIWSAQGVQIGKQRVMAQALYPVEADPLWSQFAVPAIVHSLKVYSRYTFDYPYPVATAVNGPVSGMEYPMLCFVGQRPEADGTYARRTKYGLISVLIHEVGHNFFPMMINTDERSWAWMDEGFSTFVQTLGEREWERRFPSRRGEARLIVPYMKSTRQRPIMTDPGSVQQRGQNVYAKPAAALNILRETILGRELFDFAFRTYARRWRFKRPVPADFFRTMEDATGVDLDWFWRGWFYGTDRCDISIEGVRLFRLTSGDPDVERKQALAERAEQPRSITKLRNRTMPRRVDGSPELKDFYSSYDPTAVTPASRQAYQRFLGQLSPEERKLLSLRRYFYLVSLNNIGGLVMPVILLVEFEDGTRRELRIPVEIWRTDNERATQLIVTEKPIRRLLLDPHLETADADTRNNRFPRPIERARFKLSAPASRGKNPMQQARSAGGGDKK